MGNLLEPLTNTMSKHLKAVITQKAPVEINIKANPCKEEEKATLPEASMRLTEKRLGELNQKTRKLTNIKLQFVINGPSEQYVLRVVDKSTGRLIREIQVDLQHNLSHSEEARGVIFDQKV